MLASIYGSSTLHPDLGNDIQKLVTDSSPPLNLLPKASRQWRDKVWGLVTIPSFLNSYESCIVADALSQDPGIDMKTRLDAECEAAITCARLDPSDQRTPPFSWIDWICQATMWFSTYRLMRGIIYGLRTSSALFDAYAVLA